MLIALLTGLVDNTDVPCGDGPKRVHPPRPAGRRPPEGDFYTMYAVLEGGVPLADPTNHHQDAFVFDADGIAANNHQPGADCPNDFFCG